MIQHISKKLLLFPKFKLQDASWHKVREIYAGSDEGCGEIQGESDRHDGNIIIQLNRWGPVQLNAAQNVHKIGFNVYLLNE